MSRVGERKVVRASQVSCCLRRVRLNVFPPSSSDESGDDEANRRGVKRHGSSGAVLAGSPVVTSKGSLHGSSGTVLASSSAVTSQGSLLVSSGAVLAGSPAVAS